MAYERELPPQQARRLEPEPAPDEPGHLLVEPEGDDYLDDLSDPDGAPGPECSSYIPRYSTS